MKKSESTRDRNQRNLPTCLSGGSIHELHGTKYLAEGAAIDVEKSGLRTPDLSPGDGRRIPRSTNADYLDPE